MGKGLWVWVQVLGALSPLKTSRRVGRGQPVWFRP